MIFNINFQSLILAIFVFILSLIFFDYYTVGDQLYYNYAWSLIDKSSIINTYSIFKKYLSAPEPIYSLISYFFSFIFSKKIFISFLNSLITFLLYKILRRINSHPLIILSIIPFNFYYIVILIPAERLKIGILLFVIGIYYSKNLFKYLSMFSHITLAYFLYVNYFLTNEKIKIKFILIFIFCLLIFSDVIINKILWYGFLNKFSLSGFVKTSIFTLLSLYYSHEKKLPILFNFLPLIILGALIGPERIVIFSYMMFCYYGLKVNRGINFGIISTSLYFFIKGLYFVYTFYNYGHGFR